VRQPVGASTELRDNLLRGVRDVSGIWWWYLILGIAGIWYGMFVLSYRVGRLTAVAALVGVAFLFGGFGQLLVAGHPPRDDASLNVVPVGPRGVRVRLRHRRGHCVARGRDPPQRRGTARRVLRCPHGRPLPVDVIAETSSVPRWRSAPPPRSGAAAAHGPAV
jgi:hypothetical protein